MTRIGPIHPVAIVGAGPGDPELLTVKAARLLAAADAVVYDRLVAREILTLTRPGAQMIFAGKSPYNHHMPQEDINSLLVRLARSGQKVVRLKGGDPFIFGRGGEEAQQLAEAGIPFEVVPGVTAATSCAAYAGIPLTHRGLAVGVHFVTGHCQGQSELPLELNWAGLADPDSTLVVYMGLVNVESIADNLIRHGLAPETPAAAVHKGTTAEQRVIVTTLAGLPEEVAQARLRPPTLFVIGKVVALAPQLSWFRPLQAAAVDAAQ